MVTPKILLSQGSGGRPMHNLIRELLLRKLNNPTLKELQDAAVIDYGERLAFTTDSFVVSPLKFPGGDIGKLAVCGTVNDLVMVAALPQYLSLALIVEEGLDYDILECIVNSIAFHAKKARVCIVTGDLKVVESGACDKIFINTSGIGRILGNKKLSTGNIDPGDRIIVTGNIAQHGMAVLAKRKELDLGFNIQSDCAALNSLILPIVQKSEAVKFMRDPTRGGIATTLNEIAEGCGLGMAIEENKIPILGKVRTACELLGIDPLYVANEGIAILVVKDNSAKGVLNLLKGNPLGKNAQIIGTVVKQPEGKVVLNTSLGTRRIVAMLTGDPLPRIC